MKRNVKKILVLILGIIFIILGLFGLVLPFLQGIIFLIIGLILVSFYFPSIRVRMKKHTESHPHLFSIINKIEAWIVNFLGDM